MKKVVLFLVCVLALFTACKKDEPTSDRDKPTSDGDKPTSDRIEEIKFDSEVYDVLQFDTLDLRSKLQILPAVVGDNVKIRWKSDNERFVNVSNDGVVSAIFDGDAVVTATAQGKTAKCSVRVERNIEEMRFFQSEYEFHPLSRVNLTHEVFIRYKKEPETKPEMHWYVENPSVAMVREDGWLDIFSPGETEIVVECAGEHAHCILRVKEELPEEYVVPISSMEFSERLLSYCIGGATEMYLKIWPGDASYQDVEWVSSDETVATVTQNGVVSYVGAGEAVVYAIHKAKYPGDKDAQAEAKVIVSDCEY